MCVCVCLTYDIPIYVSTHSTLVLDVGSGHSCRVRISSSMVSVVGPQPVHFTIGHDTNNMCYNALVFFHCAYVYTRVIVVFVFVY